MVLGYLTISAPPSVPFEGDRDGREIQRSSMTMVRLGNVIYWLGCIAAGITLANGAFEAATALSIHRGISWLLL